MRFRCCVNVPGCLDAGKTYSGQLVFNRDGKLRVAVFDNRARWQTYDAQILWPEEIFNGVEFKSSPSTEPK